MQSVKKSARCPLCGLVFDWLCLKQCRFSCPFWNKVEELQWAHSNDLHFNDCQLSEIQEHFTSTPMELAETALRESLRQLRDDSNTSLKNKYHLEHLKFCMQTSFTFQNQPFESAYGTPIAEIVPQKLEATAFETLKPLFGTYFIDKPSAWQHRQRLLHWMGERSLEIEIQGHSA